jgi:predicted MFS family arabinose efflux permease
MEGDQGRVAFVYHHRALRFYLLLATSVWLAFGLFGALEPLFIRDVLEADPETIGWINTLIGVGLVAGTVVAPRLSPQRRTSTTAVGLLALNGVGSTRYVGTNRLWVVAVGSIFWGLVIGVFAPLARTLTHLNSPDHLVGRVMGVTTRRPAS